MKKEQDYLVPKLKPRKKAKLIKKEVTKNYIYEEWSY